MGAASKWPPHVCQDPTFPSRTSHCNEMISVIHCFQLTYARISIKLCQSQSGCSSSLNDSEDLRTNQNLIAVINELLALSSVLLQAGFVLN